MEVGQTLRNVQHHFELQKRGAWVGIYPSRTIQWTVTYNSMGRRSVYVSLQYGVKSVQGEAR